RGHGMTAAEFVAGLDDDNQRLLKALEPDATLKPEIDGPLNVPNLLKVALKNELEATEIAARWLVSTDDVQVKLALARQVGDEAEHYRVIAARAAGECRARGHAGVKDPPFMRFLGGGRRPGDGEPLPRRHRAGRAAPPRP